MLYTFHSFSITIDRNTGDFYLLLEKTQHCLIAEIVLEEHNIRLGIVENATFEIRSLLVFEVRQSVYLEAFLSRFLANTQDNWRTTAMGYHPYNLAVVNSARSRTKRLPVMVADMLDFDKAGYVGCEVPDIQSQFWGKFWEEMEF
jgi:hypothetical protein